MKINKILRKNGIQVIAGYIKQSDRNKAFKIIKKAIASDHSQTEYNLELEIDGLIVTIDEVEFNFEHESDYGADADGNRGRSAWFASDINYKEPTHGKDENDVDVALTPDNIKAVQKKLDEMAEDMDISSRNDYSGPDRREED